MLLGIWISQGICMLFDEFYFHHKRGLGKWESLGHPIDSFLFLICFLFCLAIPYNTSYETFFIILSVISTLVITKDEFIHTKECPASENWLHALLFILHPISLFVLYKFWVEGENTLIAIQAAIIGLFMLYQLTYWNWINKKW